MKEVEPFDRGLLALANCPVIRDDHHSYMYYDKKPVIVAKDNTGLAHEICHVRKGRKDYEMFSTGVICRNHLDFPYNSWKLALNFLCDWWDEKLAKEAMSVYFVNFIKQLENKRQSQYNKWLEYFPKKFHPLVNILLLNKFPEDFPDVKSLLDLIVYTDKYFSEATEEEEKFATKHEGKLTEGYGRQVGIKGSPGADDGVKELRSSDYYVKTVSKYFSIIDVLSKIWKRNKSSNVPSFHGEVNFRTLPNVFKSEYTPTQAFQLLKKSTINRKVYIVIDRSASTESIKNIIMDSAIVITESFRCLGTPVSILDVGKSDSVINNIHQPLDYSWFVPLTGPLGTNIGGVVSQIKDADSSSYLLIITDGEPNCFQVLRESLAGFPGEHMTFVIGPSIAKYYTEIGRAISVEPKTIVQEVMRANFFGC